MDRRHYRQAGLWAALLAVSALGCFLILELAGNLYFASTRGGLFYLRSETEPPATERALAPGRNAQLSPYFGWGARPGTSVFEALNKQGRAREILRGKIDDDALPRWAHIRANNFGFYSEVPYPYVGDGMTIGIFGGSVAKWFALQGSQRLGESLSRARSPVRILSFAHGGYKQPQQLLTLAFFLSIGQRFDVVVNIDGFNEAVLTTFNEQQGIDSAMPLARRMQELMRMASVESDERTALYLSRLTVMRSAIDGRELSRRRAKTAAWYMLSDRWLKLLQNRYQELADDPPETRPEDMELIALPRSLRRDEEAQRRQIVENWAMASVLMAGLARQAGAQYLHVLQPNQYDSRHLSSHDESAEWLKSDSVKRPIVQAIYPLMRQRGSTLAAEGVELIDATGLFDQVAEPVYSDTCCHYNQRGNEILADLVVEHISP